MMPARRRPAVLLALALALATAAPALAEEIRLVSGTRYEASAVEVLPGPRPAEGDVRFTVHVGGGTATLLLPFERIDPDSLLALVGARTDLTKGSGHLVLARLALARGLYARAAAGFRRAAELDPALAGERDAGLAAIRDDLARRSLAEAEADLARGRSDLALEKARAILAGRAPDDPVAVRARGVADLAARVAERDRAQREALAAAKAKADADAAARLVEGTLARVDDLAQGAVGERDRAADPDLGVLAAQRALEAAEGRLKEGRRLLATIAHAPAAAGADLAGRDRAIVDLLVDTYLDLADIHRVRRGFDRARDYVRAAAILAPDDTRVRDARDRIDRDASAPPPVEEPWLSGGYGLGSLDGFGWGGVVVVRRYPFLVRPPYAVRPRRPVLRGPGNLPPGW